MKGFAESVRIPIPRFAFRARYSRSALILFFLILHSAFSIPHSNAAPGDVNDSGAINQIDAALIKDHLLERAPLTSGALDRADANRDGGVDLEDIAWTAENPSPARVPAHKDSARPALPECPPEH